MTVPSIVPPSMSGVFTSGDVSVLFVSVCVAVSEIRLLPADGNTNVFVALRECGAPSSVCACVVRLTIKFDFRNSASIFLSR